MGNMVQNRIEMHLENKIITHKILYYPTKTNEANELFHFLVYTIQTADH